VNPYANGDDVAFLQAVRVRGAPQHRRLGLGLFILGGGLAIARVVAGVHYPSDVAGGALIGTATGALMRFADPLTLPLVRAASKWTDHVLDSATRLLSAGRQP
jgi:membrane-associated phospholipid phosphatase